MSEQQPPKQNVKTTDKIAELTETNKVQDKVVEIGGPNGPEPTRFGDWEKKGRCIDF